MTLKSRFRAALVAGLSRAVRPFGYRLVKPANQYGVEVIADVTRLSRLWAIDLTRVFDVGANVGASALAFRAAWPACDVIAFEPNGAVAHQLRGNVETVGRVSVEQVALAAQGGQSAFFVYDDASVLGSLKETTPYTERFGLQGKTISVPVTTLDAFCRERAIDRINLLKIDAEGADYDVLLGAAHMLGERRIDFVYCEFNSLAHGEGFGSLLPIAALLSAHRYNFIASYNDYILTEGSFFSVSNALFAADRS